MGKYLCLMRVGWGDTMGKTYLRFFPIISHNITLMRQWRKLINIFRIHEDGVGGLEGESGKIIPTPLSWDNGEKYIDHCLTRVDGWDNRENFSFPNPPSWSDVERGEDFSPFSSQPHPYDGMRNPITSCNVFPIVTPTHCLSIVVGCYLMLEVILV